MLFLSQYIQKHTCQPLKPLTKRDFDMGGGSEIRTFLEFPTTDVLAKLLYPDFQHNLLYKVDRASNFSNILMVLGKPWTFICISVENRPQGFYENLKLYTGKSQHFEKCFAAFQNHEFCALSIINQFHGIRQCIVNSLIENLELKRLLMYMPDKKFSWLLDQSLVVLFTEMQKICFKIHVY